MGRVTLTGVDPTSISVVPLSGTESILVKQENAHMTSIGRELVKAYYLVEAEMVAPTGIRRQT